MSSLTFLRKFSVRFIVGLTVLAVPNIVLASSFSGSSNGFSGSGDIQQNEDGSTSVTFQLSPDTLAKVNSVLSLFGSGCDPSKIGTAINALSGL